MKSSFFSSFLGHLAGSIVSLAGVVSAINPALIPAPWGFVITLAGLVVTVAHGAYQHGGATAAAAVDAAAKAATSALKATAPVLLAVILGIGAFSLSACSTVSPALSSPSAAPYVQAAVDVAVATAESKGITAAQINTIAKQALAADQGSGATLAAISALVDAQIAKLKLPAADQAAADIVVAALSASVQTQLSANPTLAQAQTAAAVVINDVIAATGG